MSFPPSSTRAPDGRNESLGQERTPHEATPHSAGMTHMVTIHQDAETSPSSPVSVISHTHYPRSNEQTNDGLPAYETPPAKSSSPLLHPCLFPCSPTLAKHIGPKRPTMDKDEIQPNLPKSKKRSKKSSSPDGNSRNVRAEALTKFPSRSSESSDSKSTGREIKRIRTEEVGPNPQSSKMHLNFLLNEQITEIPGKSDLHYDSRFPKSTPWPVYSPGRNQCQDLEKNEAGLAKGDDDERGRLAFRSEKFHQCTCQCGILISTLADLIRHRKQAHNNNSRFCPYCTAVYSRYDSVRCHVVEKHQMPSEYWCHKCPFIADTAEAFQNHLASNHHVCKKCGKVFSRHLREHLQRCTRSRDK